MIWLSAAFGYYLVLSLINTFEDVYITGMTSCASEIISMAIAGFLYQRIDVRKGFFVSFVSSMIGGILIIVWGLDNQDSPWFFVIFLFAKSGVVCAFLFVYVANA